MKTIALPSMLGLLLCLHVIPAEAQPVTWVASNGSGAACTRDAPCLTFTAAHAVTPPAGTIKCVDAGNFGEVSITKSITIDCTGTNGGIGVASVNTGITVNAEVVLVLRGLSLDTNAPGLSGSFGVSFTGSGALHVENCRISGFTQSGINFAPSGSAKLHVSDTVISRNSAGLNGGIVVRPTGSGSTRAVLTRVQVENNGNAGVLADGSMSTGAIIIQMRDSVVAGNNGHGIAAITNAAFTAFVVDRSSSLLNGGDGIRAQGAAALVHIGNSTAIGNAGGLITASGGQILSYQNNQASGNGVDGAPTGVLTVK